MLDSEGVAKDVTEIVEKFQARSISLEDFPKGGPSSQKLILSSKALERLSRLRSMRTKAVAKGPLSDDGLSIQPSEASTILSNQFVSAVNDKQPKIVINSQISIDNGYMKALENSKQSLQEGIVKL